MRANDLRRGAMLMIGSALMFALMGAAVKVASRTLSSAAVLFFRCAPGVLALRIGAEAPQPAPAA